jgi:hypothetical protein
MSCVGQPISESTREKRSCSPETANNSPPRLRPSVLESSIWGSWYIAVTGDCIYSGCNRFVNHMDLMSSMAGFFAKQRTRQNSDPHETNAMDLSVALAVTWAEVVPIFTAFQLNRDASSRVSLR